MRIQCPSMSYLIPNFFGVLTFVGEPVMPFWTEHEQQSHMYQADKRSPITKSKHLRNPPSCHACQDAMLAYSGRGSQQRSSILSYRYRKYDTFSSKYRIGIVSVSKF